MSKKREITVIAIIKCIKISLLVNLIIVLFPETGYSQCLISGTFAIPGDYASLTAAVSALQSNGLSGPVILELQPGYSSASETFPLTLGVISCAGPANTITIRPATGAGSLSITSAVNASTVDVAGGSYWIIDGRAGGTGSSSSLTISNTSGGVSGSALRLLNGCTYNSFKYISFSGTSPSATSGVIVFGSTATIGNNNNTIDRCTINGNATAASPGSNTSVNGIYSSGSLTFPNINNTISNCSIFDCYRTQGSFTSSGILLSTGNSDWIIQTNSIFYTTAKTATGGTATVYGINISNSSGNNFQIKDNFIGGSGQLCTGTLTMTGATIFKAMNLLTGTTQATSIQGNTIGNYSINSTVSPPFEGIFASNGNYNIGDINGNIIGSLSGTGNISLITSSTSASTAESKGINVNPIINGVTNISNNQIGSITVSGSTTSVSHGFIAINNKSATTVIANNIIGTSNLLSINANTFSVNSTVQQLVGILVNCTTATVTNNVINRLNNSYAYTSNTSPVVRGIAITSAGTVSGNIIHDFYANTPQSGSTNSTIIGIHQTGNTGGGVVTISGNLIYSLKSTLSSGSATVAGLHYNSTTNTGIVTGNYIHGLLATSNNASIAGIYVSTGTATFQNNMIGIGYDTLGNSFTTPCTIAGIWEVGGSNNYYHNTIYIGGTGVSIASWQTFAFYSTVSVNSRDIRNNIFVNTRSNFTTGGKHYVIAVGGTGVNQVGLTMDNNIYFTSGTGSVFGRYTLDVASFTAWKAATGKDLFSKSVNPCLLNPNTGFPDLHLTDCSGAGNPADGAGALIPSVTPDFDGETRSALTPTDIGADAGNYTSSSLGSYNSASVTACKNSVLTPTSSPVNVQAISVIYPVKFTGIVSADPVTGNVFITDAKPAGTYTLYLRTNTGLLQNFTLTVTNPSCSRGNFSNDVSVSTGTDPVFVAVGDFNRDGNQDFVTANGTSNSITVCSGDGFGGTTGTSNITVAGSPSSVAVCDFNSDGKQDIVVSCKSSNNVQLLSGDGTGNFSSVSGMSVGTLPSFVVVGDFNNDGNRDLAVANETSNTVSVRLGNGNGTFTAASDVSVQSQPKSIALGDFNGDGNQDLAVGTYSGFVSIRLGNGTGGFTGTTNLSISGFINSVCIADFNVDGFMDVVTSNNTNVSVFSGNGNGTFGLAYYPTIQNYIKGSSIAAGDFNGDGKYDVVVPFTLSNQVITMTGGATTLTNTVTDVCSGSNPVSVAVGDFNNDGIQDVVTSFQTLNAVKISLGLTYGINLSGNSNAITNGSTLPVTSNFSDMGIVAIPYTTSRTYTINNNGSSSSTISSITFTGAHAGDFSISGITFPKSLASDSSTTFTITCNASATGLRSATVHVNYSECTTGDYSFAIQATGIIPVLYPYPATTVGAGSNLTVIPSNLPAGIQNLTATASGNFSGLITADPVSGNIRITNASPAGTYTITVFPGVTGNQTFTLTVTNPNCSYARFTKTELNSIYSNSNTSIMSVGDFNNDNSQDIVTIFSNNQLIVYSGNGNSSFNLSSFVSMGSTGSAISSFTIADFNGDGNQDLASVFLNENKITIAPGNGLGGFGTVISIPIGVSLSSLAGGDFNNDGKADILCTDNVTSTVAVLLGNGAFGFSHPADISIGAGPTSIAVGDFNADGNEDFVTTNTVPQNVSVRLGNGSGGFTGSTNIAFSAEPMNIALADFNADGKLDFAVITGISNVSIRTGNGLGNFTGSIELTGGNNIHGIAVGDYNGDGKQDLATASIWDHSLVVFTANNASGFNAGVLNSTAYFPSTVVSGNFDGDRILDLAVMNASVNKMSILTGNTGTIDLAGNGILITDGSSLISPSINTDFGPAPLNNALSRQFTILNSGAAPLTIGSITRTGAQAADYSTVGITFPLTIQGGDSVFLYVVCTPTTTGTKDAVIHVNTTGCLAGDFDFAVSAQAVIPTLGNYNPTSVIAGGNVVIVPSATPTNTPFLFATTSPSFRGIITADPLSGKVTIVDARPAGTYTVTVKAGTVSKSFLLTVNNPLCSQAAFDANSDYINYVGSNSITIGDLNSDGIQDLIEADSAFQEVIIRFGNGFGRFDSLLSFYITNYAQSLAVGDLNGDGLQDVVFVHSASNQVSCIFGDSITGFSLLPGGYTYNPVTPVGVKPVSVALADFNGDNKLDIATANYSANSVSIRLGDGSGHFMGTTEVSVGTNPDFIATGDFNNDGKTDFATTNYSSNNVSIRLGNGTGGFTGTTNITVGTNPNCIAIADFNNDGKSDFATSNSVDPNNGSVSICTGNGLGGFTLLSTINAVWPLQPGYILSGDFNGDSKQDLAVANGSFSGSLTIYMGSGSGSFSTGYSVPVSAGPGSMALGDFNSDGLQDIAVASMYELTILTGKIRGINVQGHNAAVSDGSATPSLSNNTDFGLIPVSSTTSRAFTITNEGLSTFTVNSITITGINQSNFGISGITLPVTIAGQTSKTFNVICNSSVTGNNSATIHVNYTECSSGDYDFAVSASVVTPSLGTYPTSTVNSCGNITVLPSVAPVNVSALYATASPGFTGLIEANPLTGVLSITNAKPAGNYTVTVRSGNVIRTFALTVTAPPCSPGSFSVPQGITVEYNPYCIANGDFNNDGNQDFITTTYSAPSFFTINFGSGTGGFTATPVAAISNSNQTPDYITVADFNGDGKDDIAFVGYYMTTCEIRLGDGLGGFPVSANFSTGLIPQSLSTGDFNNDGKIDIVVSNQGSNTVSIWLGDGTGSFSWSSDITASAPHTVGIADFNNDGKPDLAIASLGTSNVSIKLGNGFGGFTGSTIVTVGFDPISLQTGDFNNDGKQDILTGNVNNLTPATYSVRLGNGAGGFTGSANVTLPYAPYLMTVGDFNGDNFPDFAASTHSHNTIIVRYGNGSGGFTGTLELTDNVFVASHAIGDFNEDKVEDIISANSTSDLSKQTSLYLGTSNEINLQGNGITIPDGSTTVAIATNTDFGTVNINSPVIKTYTIQNTGLLSLTVSTITITGTHATDFSVSGVSLPLTLIAGTSVTFSVTFTPLVSGQRNAVVHVNSNDCNEADYDFAVQGIYCIPPAFTVCPGNLSVNASPGFCRQSVTYSVTASGSPTPGLTAAFSGATSGAVSGTGSGTLFNAGVTHVVISAINLCNSATCEFDITVNASVDDMNACTIDNCNTSTGTVTHTAVSVIDNNACTVDGCQSSTGVFHDPVNTDDGNECTNDGCNTITGVFNTSVNADDANACTDDGCNTLTGVYHNAVNVLDGNVCTDDGCISTTGVFHNPVIVDDNDAYTQDGCDPVSGIYHHTILNLKVYLEGFYTGNGLMNNFGAGGCLKITGYSLNALDVDTLFLTLIDGLTFLPVETSSAVLKTDGSVSFVFNSTINATCFLKLKHRNSLETWSSIAVSPAAIHFYDFTLSATQAYGNNQTEVYDHWGWAVFSGDITDLTGTVGSQDGMVGTQDFVAEETGVFSTFLGYVTEDLTGDGITESSDYVLMQNNYFYSVNIMRP